MPSILSRFAANSYWLARYLERAESLARLLDINKTYARDKPSGPDWQRIIDLYADSENFARKHKRADAASVLDFYILDRDNPTSIAYAVAAARQNGRSIRHLISTEMWTQLNIFHNRMSALTQRDIRTSNLSPVCTSIKLDCQTFEGITEGTMTRSKTWLFYQMGKYLERADQTTRVLDMGYGWLATSDVDAPISVHWNMLLRSVAGYHAYRSRHPAGSYSSDVAAFLVYDREFVRSVTCCMDRVSEYLIEAEKEHGKKRSEALESARHDLVFYLETGPGKRVTQKELHKFLDGLQGKIGRLSQEISATYFAIN